MPGRAPAGAAARGTVQSTGWWAMKDSLDNLTDLVLKRTGMRVPANRTAALEAAVKRVAPGLDLPAFLRAASDPVGGPALVEKLIDEVTVQETFFGRDRDQLDPIPWESLRDASATGIVRVWSAGCATGEEPYTLALLASEFFGGTNPPVDVLGTDVSSAALERA